jgi:hypothetical protein
MWYTNDCCISNTRMTTQYVFQLCWSYLHTMQYLVWVVPMWLCGHTYLCEIKVHTAVLVTIHVFWHVMLAHYVSSFRRLQRRLF